MIPDERIILRADPHLVPFLLPFALVILALSGVLSLDGLILPYQPLEDLSDSVFVLVLLLFIVVRYLDRRFNRLYLTTRRLVRERGIIRKRYSSVFLERVEGLSCSNGLLGEIFNFGNLEIESIEGRFLFRGIISAKRHKRRIAREVNRLRIW